jgi:hypothetical protein
MLDSGLVSAGTGAKSKSRLPAAVRHHHPSAITTKGKRVTLQRCIGIVSLPLSVGHPKVLAVVVAMPRRGDESAELSVAKQ